MSATTDLPSALQPLIRALREELEQYGAVLALLEEQQQLVVDRSIDEVLRSVDTLNREMAVVSRMREERDRLRVALARACGLPEDESLEGIAAQLPDEQRPLLQGLVLEGRRTLQRMQHRARQNHLLIQRSMEVMEQFIGALFPDAGTPTYTAGGQVQSVRIAQRPVYENVA